MPFNPDRIWHVALGDTDQQTVSGADLRNWAAAGRIGRQTLLWTQGLQDWIPAERVRGLFAAPPQPPPIPNRTNEPDATDRPSGLFGEFLGTVRGWESLWAPVGFLIDLMRPIAPFSLYVAAVGWLVWAAVRFVAPLRRRLPGLGRHALAAGLFSSFFAIGQLLVPVAGQDGLLATLFPSLQQFQDELLVITRDISSDVKEIRKNTENVKKETSEDPRKELANLGITADSYEESWSNAVVKEDIGKIRLLEAAGFFPSRQQINLSITFYVTPERFTPEYKTVLKGNKDKVARVICRYLLEPESKLSLLSVNDTVSAANAIRNLGKEDVEFFCGSFQGAAERHADWATPFMLRFCEEYRGLDETQCTVEAVRDGLEDDPYTTRLEGKAIVAAFEAIDTVRAAERSSE